MSSVAHQSFESGREHGQAVSSAARGRAGKEESEPHTEAPQVGTDTSVDSSSTAGTDQPAARGKSGSEKGGKG